jgi:membrane associated rhomboid family serine protease
MNALYNMPATYWLIAITILISIGAFSDSRILSEAILSPYRVSKHKEYWRLVTAGFLHADWSHLLLNMFVLFAFGPLVESAFIQFFGPVGKILFAAMYFSSIIAAHASSVFKEHNNPNYFSLGASGATSAVVFASILFHPLQKFYFGIPGFAMGAIYLYYSSYAAKQMSDRVNHEAHFYGAVYGFIFPIFLKPEIGLFCLMQVKNWF